MNAHVLRNILFVDDEPNILKAMKRLFRPMRNEWAMQFADSGSQALAMMEQHSYDVVVSDMRMPEMDGLQLLTEVSKRFPTVVRMVLSGYSDQDMVLEATRTVHQFLSKPCEPEILIEAVGRACMLQDLLKKDTLKALLMQTESLPSLPTLYTEIMEEVRSPHGSVHRVGKIIGKDLSMSAKVLQLVNSSFFGLSRHVSDPVQAATLLGLDTLKSLVLTIGLFSKFNVDKMSTFNIQNIFDHSIRTGAIAKAIALHESMDKDMVDNTFMAGLLHDFGKLVFAANFEKTYLKILARSQREGACLNDLEMESMGATHAEVGAYLLGLWGLPHSIVEAVAFHHHPAKLGKNMTINPLNIVHAANVLEMSGQDEMDAVPLGLDPVFTGDNESNKKIKIWKNLAQTIDCGENGNE